MRRQYTREAPCPDPLPSGNTQLWYVSAWGSGPAVLTPDQDGRRIYPWYRTEQEARVVRAFLGTGSVLNQFVDAGYADAYFKFREEQETKT